MTHSFPTRRASDLLYDRNGVLIDSVRVDFQVRRLAWTPLDKVSPTMRDTLIASEDQRFRRHHGVDWLAIIGAVRDRIAGRRGRSEEHTSELQSLMRISYAVFCLKKKPLQHR